jgi:hypothetical protein
MRLVLVGVLAVLGAGCPGHGWPNEGGGGGASRGSLLAGQGPEYCAIYPHEIESWQAPLKLPPSCPYEGWVRQVIRDIHEIDACAGEGELRVVLGIDKAGDLTSVDVTQPASLDVRRCVNHALRGWDFASASAAGSLLVVYRPTRSPAR